MSEVNWPGDHAELFAQLARQRDRYEQLVNNISDLLMLIEPDGTVAFCNRHRDLPPGGTTYPPVGARATDCVAEADRPTVAAAIKDVLEGRVAMRELLFRISDGGDERIIEGTLRPVVQDGRVTQVQFLGRDVTERERAAEALRRANESLTRRQAELQRDLDVAAKIHTSLLPAPLVNDWVLIDLHHVPLLGVGGDYVYIYRDEPQRPAVVVFDVAGHGIASALVANRFHSAVYAIMHEGSPLPEMLQRLNRFIYEKFSDLGVFVTLLAVQLDLPAGQLCYCGAGHPPGLLKRARTSLIDKLPSQHLPIGVAASPFLGEPVGRVEIAPGDVLWLYTDGLMELRREPEGILGVEGLVGHLRRCNLSQPNPGMARRCMETVLGKDTAPEDDITLVTAAVRRTGDNQSPDRQD